MLPIPGDAVQRRILFLGNFMYFRNYFYSVKELSYYMDIDIVQNVYSIKLWDSLLLLCNKNLQNFNKMCLFLC